MAGTSPLSERRLPALLALSVTLGSLVALVVIVTAGRHPTGTWLRWVVALLFGLIVGARVVAVVAGRPRRRPRSD